jgi:hypothetical protein
MGKSFPASKASILWHLLSKQTPLRRFRLTHAIASSNLAARGRTHPLGNRLFAAHGPRQSKGCALRQIAPLNFSRPSKCLSAPDSLPSFPKLQSSRAQYPAFSKQPPTLDLLRSLLYCLLLCFQFLGLLDCGLRAKLLLIDARLPMRFKMLRPFTDYVQRHQPSRWRAPKFYSGSAALAATAASGFERKSVLLQPGASCGPFAQTLTSRT